MSSQGFRIPRMAAALLVFGGASCGDDEKKVESGPAGIKTSDARIRKVSRDVCIKQDSCGWELTDDVDEEPLTTSECTAELIEQFTRGEFVQAGGDACVDAYLDLYECYAVAGCEDEDACAELRDAVYAPCDF